MRHFTRGLTATVVALGALSVAVIAATASSGGSSPLSKVKHVVVIYEENHSFDNLYGGWEGVNGLKSADAAHSTQVDQAGAPYICLKQNDANLAARAATCTDAAHSVTSAFENKLFTIDPLIPSDRKSVV